MTGCCSPGGFSVPALYVAVETKTKLYKRCAHVTYDSLLELRQKLKHRPSYYYQ